jgi:beta-glucosidase
MTQFPQSFTWGTATSSYQIEGGWQQAGKGLSIWDAFTHTPGKIIDGSNGDMTCDHYHNFKKDIALMAKQGLKAYRFSLSWPRIQPQGYGKANKEGIEFYSDLIDTLLEHDIEPWVTLYHWDLPLTLQLEYDGWLNPEIADFYKAYAEICFDAFGDRVKHWITLNEAWVVAMLGYGQAVFAPGRESKTEPYIAAHHLLRAHAYAVDTFRKKYQHKQNGLIGITNNCDWREPLTDSQKDKAAAQRALEFFLGWFADPIYLGAYPPAMQRQIPQKLPRFSDKDIKLIKNSSDFFGLNHYTTLYASHADKGKPIEIDVYGNGGIAEDQYVNLTRDEKWQVTPMGWAIVPWGCRNLLHWIDQRYDHPPVVITENGCALDDKVVDGKVDDQARIDFVRGYLSEIHAAMKQGVDLRGYFLWSFMDNFEWASGFTKRFGINYVDFSSGERIAKSSAKWYSQVVKNNGF